MGGAREEGGGGDRYWTMQVYVKSVKYPLQHSSYLMEESAGEKERVCRGGKGVQGRGVGRKGALTHC